MRGKSSVERLGLAVLVLFIWIAPAAHAQDADALSLIVDQRGEIYRVNYLQSPAVQLITTRKVKQGSAVAIGRIGAQNFAFIGNLGNQSEVLMLIEPQPDSLNWTQRSFSNKGASALVVTRNDDVLYVARASSATIERYSRGAGNGATLGYPTVPSGSVGPVKVNGSNCTSIVGLEEYPAGSGDLLAVCAKPAGAVLIRNPAPKSPPAPTSFAFVPGSGVSGIMAGAVTTVPLTVIPAGPPPQEPRVVGQRDYLLLVVGSSEVMALDLASGVRQRNLLTGSGNVRSIGTGLCNFSDPDNDVDTDFDVDGPCAVIAQSGSEGLATLFEIEAVSGSTNLFATVRDGVEDSLRNPFGIDFANTHTVRLADCLAANAPAGCRVANNQVTLYWNTVAGDAYASFETQGPFLDKRYNPASGLCERSAAGAGSGMRVELPLDFTRIPVLEHAIVGPEFCARDGVFFVDIVTAPEVTPASGFTQYETPGDCWMTGYGGLGSPDLDLDEIEYGLLFGDEYDLFRLDGTNALPGGILPTAQYTNNFYAQDNLIGCGTRERAGGRLTFVIEDFEGNRLMGDLGSRSLPIGDNVLYQYGLREANERINIPVNATQSGCHEELLANGHLAGACAEHVVALNGGLAGWALQREVGKSATITGSMVESAAAGGAVAVFPNLFAASGLTGRLAATPGVLTFRDALTRVVGISGLNTTELDIGEQLSFTVSTIPRPADAILPGAGPAVPVSVNVPFVLDSATLALLFDGDEFGDVQEVAKLVATTHDDILTAILVNTWEPNGAGDTFAWQVTSATGKDVSDLQILDRQVLSGDNSSAEFATVRLNSPFGTRAMLSLDITALPGTPAAACPSCNNPSDFAVAELKVSAPDRVAALAFAYRNYLQALCPVSTRPVSSTTLGTRPQLCSSGPVPEAFNLVAATAPGIPAPRNLAGHQQADVEGVLRFIGHNICELDFGAAINPAGVALGPGGFCGTRPEWIAPTTP